ncbi:MAG: succinyl-diaminopimelate desuccinylase [Acidimicrobiales bacterium]
MTDLLALTASLVDISSVSHHERELVDDLEDMFGEIEHLDVTRVGDNLVARTELGRDTRVVLAGHTDTVPPQGNETSRILGDRLYGVGSCDMKAGLAVMLDLARRHGQPAVDVTYVLYAREEVAGVHSGLGELFREVPELLKADIAVLGEPTGGRIEAGCQGTMRARLRVNGQSAHTARAWMGDNAIHHLAPLLQRIADHEPRRPIIDGCQFHEALQAVSVEGGVALNVVPDSAEVVVNFRFAPDLSAVDAEKEMRSLVGAVDEFEVTEMSPGALPAAHQPLIERLVQNHQLEVHAKLGWTDVARFAKHGIPAVNFGPGQPELAHTSGEYVERAELDHTLLVLEDLLIGE